jgi:hypothetical protein
MTTTTQEMHALVTAPGLGIVQGAEKPLVVQRRPVPLDALRPLGNMRTIGERLEGRFFDRGKRVLQVRWHAHIREAHILRQEISRHTSD